MKWIAIIFWNMIVFAIFGADYKRGIQGRWRISENLLITLAFGLGSFGSILGLLIYGREMFRRRFPFWILAALIVNIIFISYMDFNPWSMNE